MSCSGWRQKFATVMSIHVSWTKCSSELQKVDAGDPFPYFPDKHLAELHFYTVLHLMGCSVCFQFGRHTCSPELDPNLTQIYNKISENYLYSVHHENPDVLFRPYCFCNLRRAKSISTFFLENALTESTLYCDSKQCYPKLSNHSSVAHRILALLYHLTSFSLSFFQFMTTLDYIYQPYYGLDHQKQSGLLFSTRST